MRHFRLLKTFCTAASRELGPVPSMRSDFSKTPAAPSSSSAFAFFGDRLVITITAIPAVAGSCFKAFSTSGPLTFGSIISSSTNASKCSRGTRKASSPSPAHTTSYPALLSARSVDTRRNLLSSTNSTFIAGLPSQKTARLIRNYALPRSVLSRLNAAGEIGFRNSPTVSRLQQGRHRRGEHRTCFLRIFGQDGLCDQQHRRS